MTSPQNEGSVQAVYNFWLELIPQFFRQLGAGIPAGENVASAALAGLAFPADQVTRAATMTQEALHYLARGYAPMLQVAPGLLGPWAPAMPPFPNSSAKADGDGGASAAASMFGPWAAAMPFFSVNQAKPDSPGGTSPGTPGTVWPWMAAMPFTASAQGNSDDAARAANVGMPSLQAMQQAWLDFAARLIGGSPQAYATAFDRTFGGLSDALGFGPMRKLQAAWQDLAAAGIAQNETRATYAVLVQGAFAAGLEALMIRLAQMADAGERVDSLLALLRLWAVSTEQAVHQVLQSKQGLAATAALARAGLTYRRKLQHLAGIVADVLDMATRRELDEAYREIQDLKRELRALRAPVPSSGASAKSRARTRKRKST